MQPVVVSDLRVIREAVQELYGSSLKKIGRPEFYKPYPEMIEGGTRSLISPCSLEKMPIHPGTCC